ncbi:MAG: type II secretion system protein GspE, partial [Burkholderiales bacterium]
MAKLLGEILQARGKLDAAGLERALRLQEGSDRQRLGQLLITLGLVSERDVMEALAEQLALPLLEAKSFPELPILEERVSHRFLKEARVLPVREDESEVVLAMADPLDHYAIDAFRLVTQREVKPALGLPNEIDAALERLYGSGKSAMGQILGESVETRIDEGSFDADIQQLKDLASEAPVIRLVSLIISHALETRASDIHIEPFENRLIVRYRVDGVLHEAESPPRRLSAAVISRVKIMASLDIAERRLPQ